MDKQARVKELWRETNPDRFADKRQGNPTIRQFLDRVERHIAALSRFIGAISRALAVEGDVTWAETLQQVVPKHNDAAEATVECQEIRENTGGPSSGQCTAQGLAETASWRPGG